VLVVVLAVVVEKLELSSVELSEASESSFGIAASNSSSEYNSKTVLKSELTKLDRCEFTRSTNIFTKTKEIIKVTAARRTMPVSMNKIK